MKWRPRSLRTQITAAVAVLVTVVVALAGLVIVARIDHRDRTDIDRQLTARAEKVHQDADKLLGQGDHESADEGRDDYGGLLEPGPPHLPRAGHRPARRDSAHPAPAAQP
ncbi:hypothetical protein AB0D71_46830 [Streptomyces avermitilis]|uniref:hypothetical protein n=1 Tax=Streptomyces avermitilis TaxID=33903 RepID=UPI0033FD7293